jgi:hypothetical protein
MPDVPEEESVDVPEAESAESSQEKRARLKFRIVLAALLIVGLPLMFLPEVNILHLPDWPWLFEIGSKLGDAMVIAAILAFAVDNYVKRTLVSEVAKDAIDFAVGYALPFEVKTHLRDILRLPCVRQNLVFSYEFREMPPLPGYPDHFFQVTCITTYEILNLTHGPINFEVRTSVQKSQLPGLPPNQLCRLYLPTLGIDKSAEQLKERAAEQLKKTLAQQLKKAAVQQLNKKVDTKYNPYTTASWKVDIEAGKPNALPVETKRLSYHRLEDSIFLDLLQPPSLGLELKVTAPAEFAFEASFGAAGQIFTDHSAGCWHWEAPDVHLPGSHLYMAWHRVPAAARTPAQTKSMAAPTSEPA